jgi:hypothetical protein
MSRRLLVALAGVAFVGSTAACAARGAEAPPRADPGARLLEDRAFDEATRRDIFVERGLRVAGRSGAEIRTQLGEPREVSARAVPNLHEPAVTDSVLTWRYDDLDVEIYRAADGRRLLARASVRHNRYLTFPEVGLGVNEADLQRLLGSPDVAGAGELEYRCERCEGPPLMAVLSLEGGQVVQVDFLFAVD